MLSSVHIVIELKAQKFPSFMSTDYQRLSVQAEKSPFNPESVKTQTMQRNAR